MKRELSTIGHLGNTRSLAVVLMLFIIKTASGLALASDDRVNVRERFNEADREIQAVKQEILEINREILLLEEQLLYPQGQQLVVFVSLTPDSPVTVNSISLSLDGQVVSRHVYTRSEEAALHNRGIHRLYVGRLRDGAHVIDVSLSATVEGGKNFRHQKSARITKSSGRKVVELEIAAVDRQTEPQFAIHEW